jgi:hypothetical protein
VALKNFDGSNLEATLSGFSIHIHYLISSQFSNKAREPTKASVEEVMKVYTQEDKIGLGKILRIRVNVISRNPYNRILSFLG